MLISKHVFLCVAHVTFSSLGAALLSVGARLALEAAMTTAPAATAAVVSSGDTEPRA